MARPNVASATFTARTVPRLSARARWALLFAAGLQAWMHAASAEDGTTTGTALETVTVIATGVSSMDAASAGDVSQEELASRALLRPGAVLENVPGLIVTQHSGEGKANQYFLRAFNLDHGTDLATEVDDMPVNMPTHAHGQGYTDLNFLIPELVSDLHFKKGPYYADEGDFATAGAVRMDLVDEIAADSATLGLGEDGYRRALLTGINASWSPARCSSPADIYHNDGPFDYPDDYKRRNGVLRYHRATPGLLHASRRWPTRAPGIRPTRCPSMPITDGDHRPLRQPRPLRRRRVQPLQPVRSTA